MGRKLLDFLGGLIFICAGIGSPIAIVLLLLGPRIQWWGNILSEHHWLAYLLIVVFISQFVVGAWLHKQFRKQMNFLHSPEGRNHRKLEVQNHISAIIETAREKPKYDLDPSLFSGVDPSSVITEARRLAKDIAKADIRGRGIKFPHEVNSADLSRIASAILESDPSIVAAAKENILKRDRKK